jgi:hypothetical protein
VIFSGQGMAKGVNYTDMGISGVIDSKGQGAMITTSGGKAEQLVQHFLMRMQQVSLSW